MMPSLPIVGIGASAGGVEALEQFFKSRPAGNGLAFVVLTHLPPDRESMLSEILGRATRMPVVDARDGEKVEAEHVYVLPPSAILTIRGGNLQLRRTGPADREARRSTCFLHRWPRTKRNTRSASCSPAVVTMARSVSRPSRNMAA